ncbi:MAG: bifunctional transcriptional activator/DNA repair protein Ada [Armatimonadetes bacterium]|nr:bifunctional transcriptional activator/DNA repair protein Ada [Armatimonadota bacterium]MBS1712145.1 bifunctional transcriptional activator/DNA repair protein Ada [Armatimonadota bacterium]MBX3107852.1 bifunctional transcriptional activator/DNA repair protein Ada [Fimbriimonadaceae bacterium]
MDRPLFDRVYAALEKRSPEFDRIWYTCVKTTKIFCRPICPARTPLKKNVEFLGSPKEAMHAGYRPCKRCRPLDLADRPPAWLADLRNRVETGDGLKLKDQDLRQLGLDPVVVRRQFKRQMGLTFHEYQRAWRMGRALAGLRKGDDPVDAAIRTGYASESGFRAAFEQVIGAKVAVGKDAEPAWAKWIETPIGGMVAVAVDQGLGLLEFVDRPMLETQLKRYTARTGRRIVPGNHPLLDTISRELRDYFEGKLQSFSCPIELSGTAFQVAVWKELLTIGYGELRSYSDQARRIGNPTAVRAVGRANGDNRLAIIVPCHRVVGAGGDLTGYGGGLWRKKRLLELEGSAERLSK